MVELPFLEMVCETSIVDDVALCLKKNLVFSMRLHHTYSSYFFFVVVQLAIMCVRRYFPYRYFCFATYFDQKKVQLNRQLDLHYIAK